MRVLLAPMGSAGDVHPFIGLGRALQARGHEVICVINEYYRASVLAAGLGYHEFGKAAEFERVTTNPDLWHPKRAFETLIREAISQTYEPAIDAVRELHQPGNTVIVAGTLAFAFRNARDLLGVPLVTAHLAPAIFFSRYRMPRIHGAPAPQWAPGWFKALQWSIASRITDGIVLPGLNAVRRKHGLAPARDVIRNWWHSPDLTLGLFPDWFGPPQRDWPAQVKLTGFPMFDDRDARPMPPELARFLDESDAANERPVVFTPGSAMAHGREFFVEAAKAMQQLGKRALLLSQYPETIPAALPPNVQHFTWAPFSELLPRAAALVYHGGVGTCAQAMHAGIPHLIQHMAHDQLDNLSRMHDLGIGTGAPPAKFKAKWISRTVAKLTSDSRIAANCKQVAARFETAHWLQQTCELIENAGSA